MSIATKESKRIALKRKRELQPEGTVSMRRECDRLSKARHSLRALESESEALLRKELDRASKARKRALEPESEALPRKERDRASKANKRAFQSHRVNRISTTNNS